MNYVLTIILLVVCYGAYYEVKSEQDKILAAQLHIDDLSQQVAKLQDDNKKITDDNAALQKNLKDAQSQITDLTKQQQSPQTMVTDGAAPAAPSKTPPPASTPTPTPVSNDLGTISTPDGKTYQSCQLLKVQTDGIVVSHSTGITEIKFVYLPADLQKRFGYDPNQPTGLTASQVQNDESLRQAAVMQPQSH